MPDDIIEREVLGEASRACGALVDRVRARVARKGGATAGELCQYAAEAFQTYAETLLRALMAAASRRESGDVEAWVRRQFHAGMDNAGMPLREAVAESPHRHAVAQGLQQKMFEAEADAPPGTQGALLRGPDRRTQAGRAIKRGSTKEGRRVGSG